MLEHSSEYFILYVEIGLWQCVARIIRVLLATAAVVFALSRSTRQTTFHTFFPCNCVLYSPPAWHVLVFLTFFCVFPCSSIFTFCRI